MNYWLFKSEPDAFSIDDLKAMKGKKDHWDGIRNYQARNLMRDEMKKGDLGFFYHSSCKVPGIVGIVEVVREAYPDHTALDPESKYHDPKSTVDDPRWVMVDVRFKRKFDDVLSLSALREVEALSDMVLLRKGSRLSIQPVTESQWQTILGLAS
ncbi:EVE domain-containing protein [Granulosicoccus sp. 3-233]|uniref:EVE domain-containing protein n=1 Tax=Granulosicoccus sp. 3-233 TaxID=3417969 RepID=UPI003D34C7DD